MGLWVKGYTALYTDPLIPPLTPYLHIELSIHIYIGYIYIYTEATVNSVLLLLLGLLV